MTSQKPVVVYAASGYTGQLICESLGQLRVPFVAAGRSADKLSKLVSRLRAQGADCVAHAVEHTPAGLRSLLRGARVVINVSGPFSLLGHEVVSAALDEGVHYLDTTGEQDFMFDLRRDFGQRFEAKQLLLSPSASFLWAPGSAVAELCLDVPGIDSLTIAYAPPSLQTVASLQSMMRSARRPGYYIDNGRLTSLPPDHVHDVELPGGELRRGLRVGSGEITFLQGDPRVRFADTTFTSNQLARVAPIFGMWNRISRVFDGDMLDRVSDAVIPKLKKDPPAEDPATQSFIIKVVGEGKGKRVKAFLRGHSPYISTGFIAAFAAQGVLEGKAKRTGYASLAQAFGARYVLTRLQEIGTQLSFEGPASERAESAITA